MNRTGGGIEGETTGRGRIEAKGHGRERFERERNGRKKQECFDLEVKKKGKGARLRAEGYGMGAEWAGLRVKGGERGAV